MSASPRSDSQRTPQLSPAPQHSPLPDSAAASPLAGLPFPAEVVLRVFEHINPPLSKPPAIRQAQITFNQLSLTSRAFYKLVNRVRYKRVLLRDATGARLLLDQADSAAQSQIKHQLELVAFGKPVTSIEECVDSEVFAEWLTVLGDGAEHVMVEGVRVGSSFMWAIRRRVKTLELAWSLLDFAPHELRLPAAVHLTLNNAHLADRAAEWATFFRPADLPRLRDLSLRHHPPADADADAATAAADRTEALRALAPQLEALSLMDDGAWLGSHERLIWTDFRVLRFLRVREPAQAERGRSDVGLLVRACLEGLPTSLEMLNIATRRRTSFNLTAANVSAALGADLPSVAKLQTLVVPHVDALRGAKGGMADFNARNAWTVLVAQARASGIAVGVIDYNDD